MHYLPLTWTSRTERPDGKTSPEELVAAAHASCYAMAFSNTLAEQACPVSNALRGNAGIRVNATSV